MTGPWIRRVWLWLASVPALVLPVPALFVAWLVFLARGIQVETFCAVVLVVLVFGFVAWTARLSLYARRWLTRFGWELP